MKNLRKWLLWLLPHGLHVARTRQLMRAAEPPDLVAREELRRNEELRDRHAGQRCFVLGNGPSAKTLDLAALQGRCVISVSNGYLHSGYAEAAPRYHCVPQITYGRMTRDDAVKWFKEMHEGLGLAELFLNETEAELVRTHGLFPGRKVHYLAFRENFDQLQSRDLIDLASPIPRVESVPVMAIMIAMYMGFKDVVLLGVDHDHFMSRQYLYAFELGVQSGKDISTGACGEVQTPWHDEFQSLARLWRQYRVLRDIALKNGIRIVNATPGGELDEFPRAILSTLIAGQT
ncbi:hypothetical protein [Polaromonas sp.]|uniref:hypothetical protein n=1 Tax=Polaromonas sp. TaxID=1869339 RepID=UPI003267546A